MKRVYKDAESDIMIDVELQADSDYYFWDSVDVDIHNVSPSLWLYLEPLLQFKTRMSFENDTLHLNIQESPIAYNVPKLYSVSLHLDYFILMDELPIAKAIHNELNKLLYHQPIEDLMALSRLLQLPPEHCFLSYLSNGAKHGIRRTTKRS